MYSVGALLFAQGLLLFLLGQPWICACGYVKLWEGVVSSVGNSQHISDWYTFSHVIHGILFFWFLSVFFKTMPLRYRFLLALGIEVLWEVVENTPWVINAYREQALAQGYVGDSILNSLCDTLAAAAGFFLAYRLQIAVTIALIVFFEVFVGYMIHDNLTLNVLNFFYQFDAVSQWQQRVL